jgi:hypothetical protein
MTPEEYYRVFLILIESIGYMAVERDGVVFIVPVDTAR